jgi:hypothetical protein
VKIINPGAYYSNVEAQDLISGCNPECVSALGDEWTCSEISAGFETCSWYSVDDTSYCFCKKCNSVNGNPYLFFSQNSLFEKNNYVLFFFEET